MNEPARAPDPRDASWRKRLAGEPLSPAEEARFAAFALEKVSRTFALNIRALREPLRGQVLHAYLYCRMADTLEDDAALPAAQKAALLHAFAAPFHHDLPAAVGEQMAAVPPALMPPEWRAAPEWEKILLARAPALWAAYGRFPGDARRAVGDCVREMCAGMAGFALRQEAAARAGTAPVGTLEDLDRYCWYVAGTVGEMLCGLFLARGGIPEPRAARMRALCASFGTGLQLVNILQDVGDDGARGVSWLPAGVPRAVLIRKAAAHLDEALEYTLAIPRRHRDLRLFCLWPLLMAAETLALIAARERDARGGAGRPRIARARVARIVRRTSLLWWSDRALRAEYAASAASIARALHDAPPADTFGDP